MYINHIAEYVWGTFAEFSDFLSFGSLYCLCMEDVRIFTSLQTIQNIHEAQRAALSIRTKIETSAAMFNLG